VPSEAILQFSPFSVLGKRGPGLFLQYFKNTTVLVNTSVLKLHYFVTSKHLKLFDTLIFLETKVFSQNLTF
jgi:hypothetical protein